MHCATSEWSAQVMICTTRSGLKVAYFCAIQKRIKIRQIKIAHELIVGRVVRDYYSWKRGLER